MANTYKNTMNLPATDFPMRGNLPENEPKRLEKWEQEKIYWRVLEKNKDGELLEEPVKKNDHAVDALCYACFGVRGELSKDKPASSFDINEVYVY